MAQKYGMNSVGQWERDDSNLPCFRLQPARVPSWFPPLRHHVGGGRLHLLGDHLGRVQLVVPTAAGPVCLSTQERQSWSGFTVTLRGAAGQEAAFVLSELADPESAVVVWGLGYLRYEGEVRLGEVNLRATLELGIPPGQALVVARLGLAAPVAASPAAVSVRFGVEVEPSVGRGQPARPAQAFRRDGVVVLGDLVPGAGDLFLAGAPEWKPAAAAGGMALEREWAIPAGAAAEAVFLVGVGPDCSVERLRQLLAAHTPASVRAGWSQRTATARVRAPELWMQEDCLWCNGRLLALACQNGPDERAFLSPGGVSLFGPALRPDRAAAPVAVRDLLTLVLPLLDLDPDLARANLHLACAAQSPAGRLPEAVGQTPGRLLDPRTDRSDLEIWFLLAWVEFVTSREEHAALDAVVPFADGSAAPVWEHLRRAWVWLRNEVRSGPHGLVRMLAGDWNGDLDRVGREGRGESVLNTALAAYALRRLTDLSRRRGDADLARDAADGLQALSAALAATFDGRVFCRAYTDSGRALGDTADGRLFASVQAWVSLARGGTAAQRQTALQSVLAARTGEGPVADLSEPYLVTPPADVSSRPRPRGDGENGGVSPAVCAWLAWALAREGHRDLAMREWEAVSLRRRCHGEAGLAPALAEADSWFAGAAAGARAGQPGLRAGLTGLLLPSAQAVAWQGFAMRRILAGSGA